MVNVNYMCSWVEHSTHFFKSITSLRNTDLLTDVTITCGDKQFRAHSLVLCASSDYFRRILVNNTQKSAYVHIIGVPAVFIQNILQYLYTGQIEITPSDVEPFLKVANDLKISGLCKDGSETDASSANTTTHPHEKMNEALNPGFPVKRTLASDLMPPTLNPPLPLPAAAANSPTDYSVPRRSYDNQESRLPQTGQKDLMLGNRFDPTNGPGGRTGPVDVGKGEHITIMPDISEMTDTYDSISDEAGDGQEGDGSESEVVRGSSSPSAQGQTTDSPSPNSAAPQQTGGGELDLSNPPYKITLNSLAVDPAVSRKRKTVEEKETNDKTVKMDRHPEETVKVTRQPALVPPATYTSPLTSINTTNSLQPMIHPVNCRKGNSGMYCSHRIVALPDGRKVHYNKHEYDQWLQQSNQS